MLIVIVYFVTVIVGGLLIVYFAGSVFDSYFGIGGNLPRGEALPKDNFLDTSALDDSFPEKK